MTTLGPSKYMSIYSKALLLLLLALSYWVSYQADRLPRDLASSCGSVEGGLGGHSQLLHPHWAVVSLTPGNHLPEHQANMSAWRLLVLGEDNLSPILLINLVLET